MANVVIAGAGLGGLPTAYELRHYLPSEHRITLISERPKFTFIPGLIRVALGLASVDGIQLDLASLTRRHGINWIPDAVTTVNPHQQYVTVGKQVIEYDYLVIATGASLGFDEVPGLGPHGGYTQSVCTPDHSLAAREAWFKFLENGGPLVVGAMSGAGCFGPAYEFVLMADWVLRRRGIRDRVSITYVSPEPYVGHMGIVGLKNSRELTGRLMKERGIKTIDNARITAINPETIDLENGQQLPFKYAMILPTFRGVKFVRETPGLGNEQGFIPVTNSHQHPQFPTIYAAGVSVHLEQPETTPIAIGLPKTGQMTEVMGAAVAHNIAVELGAIKPPLKTPTLEVLCLAEFGDTGIAYIAAPILPDPETGKRRFSSAIRGRWIIWFKAAFERYFMLKMRWGLGLPWFEKLGLRLLFGLSVLKPLPKENIISCPNHQ
ncbi:NAD(P)/FAD-dependent oxidoreductase [Capilliphycus salinus ALCB114379]|uniref:NAD(P)/FAD-dependent oxidoreductase n=1 Tax=Capilliphycus salinus TaxID=2768948 RepID=UPI0039A402DD